MLKTVASMELSNRFKSIFTIYDNKNMQLQDKLIIILSQRFENISKLRFYYKQIKNNRSIYIK